MALIKDADRQTLSELFAGSLSHDVRLVLFTQQNECQYCAETRQIVEELAGIDTRLHAEIHDFVADKALADELGIDKIPAVAIIGAKDYGIRFYGIPAGYEFTGFVETIVAVSLGESGLSEETKRTLAELKQPVHLQVFVTPTCPYCPPAVHLAHRMAIESDLVRADGVEAIEFPHLSTRYQVQGVPRTVINEKWHLEGAAPEAMLLQQVLSALQ